ncbi:hypothetical protein HPB49_024861 [Dermacentor silvarum]|uniref:Uncharacterized protein n=1 Tax=Dermacentor silvarum TaxID=543639 RepID=A0ACB8DHU7_DERSI|nr:uncharacterized protein LOC119440565 [Dermacentor silvarum]KAH7967441.1 hypothetical protein HPB49_024861 [Dermacentor silvarum]
MTLLSIGYLLETPGCSFPLYNPYHWSVSYRWERVNATNVTYEEICSARNRTVILQEGGKFSLDSIGLLLAYNATVQGTKCYYHVVSRDETAYIPDTKPILGPARSLPFGEPIDAEYVQVSCEARGKLLFTEYFLIPQPKQAVPDADEPQADGAASTRQMSVLLLGIDSTSRINFNRLMKKTRKYIIEELNAFELLGFNKVGDSSFPNQLPLLSGFSGPDAESLFKRYSFDTFPLLWNTFRLEGYTTLFLEEMPYYGLFTYPNYLGFNRPPTDYYPEPVLRMMDEKGGNDRFCVGSRLKTKVLIRYLADVLKMNVNRSMFSYVWLSDVTHNNLKGIKVIDQPLEEFFRQLSDAGIFENTAVLFLSDHGNRIGPYRMSEIGRHEDKTPFCFLILPRRFLQEYPEAVVQLEVNQRRLVTHYDLHATMLSLSKLPAFNPEPTNKGLNVFTVIPPERTCADAFIAPEFCACTGTTGETPDPGVMLSFSRYSVSYINALAMLHFPGKCIEWQLESVDEASALGGRVAGKLLLRVQVTLTPTAHFEVYGTLRNASLDDKHVDFVQRLDKYSNGTTCLPNSAWQKVCMCKPELLNISSTFQSPDSASLDDMAGS